LRNVQRDQIFGRIDRIAEPASEPERRHPVEGGDPPLGHERAKGVWFKPQKPRRIPVTKRAEKRPRQAAFDPAHLAKAGGILHERDTPHALGRGRRLGMRTDPVVKALDQGVQAQGKMRRHRGGRAKPDQDLAPRILPQCGMAQKRLSPCKNGLAANPGVIRGPVGAGRDRALVGVSLRFRLHHDDLLRRPNRRHGKTPDGCPSAVWCRHLAVVPPPGTHPAPGTGDLPRQVS